jgi:hypothetical protein
MAPITCSTVLHRPWRAVLSLVAALAVLVACGGGGGVGEGGTGSFVAGPISGFGSVIVKDARFELDAATVVLDEEDAPFDASRLRLGMMVGIDGSALPSTPGPDGLRSATARHIRVGSELLGPVSFGAGSSLKVLGLPVDAATAVVDDASLPGGLASLAAGDIVEVYGFFDPQVGRYVATRIERKNVVPERYKVRGIVSTVAAPVFVIAGQSFRFATASGTMTVGQFVRLKVRTVQDGGVWVVEEFEDSTPALGDSAQAKVEGVVTRFDSRERFAVNGIEVSTSSSTVFDDEGTVALGVRVEVEGTVVNGVLAAREVEIESEDEVGGEEKDLRGPIASIDRAARTFTLLEHTVDYATTVEYEPDGRSESDLREDVKVEVKGVLSADGTRLVAREIKFR